MAARRPLLAHDAQDLVMATVEPGPRAERLLDSKIEPFLRREASPARPVRRPPRAVSSRPHLAAAGGQKTPLSDEDPQLEFPTCWAVIGAVHEVETAPQTTGCE